MARRTTDEIELDDFIGELSRHIGNDYKTLAHVFDMDRTDIESIECRDPKDLREQIHQFFVTWKQQQGRNASIDLLMSGLNKAKLSYCLEKMKRKDRSTEVTDDGEYFVVDIKQPSEPVPVHQGQSKTRSTSKSRSVDSSSLGPSGGQFCSEGTRYRTDAASCTRTSRSPSVTSLCSGYAYVAEDDGESIQLVFQNAGGSQIDVLKLQGKGKATIRLIPQDRFEVRGKIKDCCQLLDKLLRQARRSSSKRACKEISITGQQQWNMVVGTSGCIHKAITSLSGAKVTIADSLSFPKACTIEGFCGQVTTAETLIQRALEGEDILLEATHENILSRLKKDLEKLCAFRVIEKT